MPVQFIQFLLAEYFNGLVTYFSAIDKLEFG